MTLLDKREREKKYFNFFHRSDMYFVPTLDDTFGNAIIGKAIKDPDSKILNVEGFERRSACRMFLNSGSNWSLAIINVHLDEKMENTRIAQINMLLKWLDGKGKYLPHIICGDFNALSEVTPEDRQKRSRFGLEVSNKYGGHT